MQLLIMKPRSHIQILHLCCAARNSLLAGLLPGDQNLSLIRSKACPESGRKHSWSHYRKELLLLQVSFHFKDALCLQDQVGMENVKPAVKIAITADSHFRDIQAVLGDSGLATIHTRGVGSNPFARTQVHGYRGVAFEVMRNGYMASMTLFHVQ